MINSTNSLFNFHIGKFFGVRHNNVTNMGFRAFDMRNTVFSMEKVCGTVGIKIPNMFGSNGPNLLL